VTLHAWAHALTSNEITAYRTQIPSLGVVLYPSNYSACQPGDVAYVPSPEAAVKARAYPFTGFILGRDEPNVTGPSGTRMPPGEARRNYETVRATLSNVPGWTVPASLAATGHWWRKLFGRLVFDDAYYERRGVNAGVAWAPSSVAKREIERVLDEHAGPHVMSPALWTTWRRVFQPDVEWWASLATDTVVIAIWSLEQWPTQSFGLFTQHGEMTKIGREVRDALAS